MAHLIIFIRIYSVILAPYYTRAKTGVMTEICSTVEERGHCNDNKTLFVELFEVILMYLR